MTKVLAYRIANHFFSVEGDAEADLLQALPGFPVFCCENPSQQEWLVRFGCDVPLPDCWEVLYRTTNVEGAYSFTFAKAEDCFYFFMDGQMSQPEPLLMRFACNNVVEATRCTDASVLRFALWMAYGMLAASSRIVLIHSSVIVHQRQAVLFLGESGTGKSTHTRLWLQHIPDSHLLNDDSPILAMVNGRPMIYGTPWSGKTHHYHPYSFPLAAAMRLSQAPVNQIARQGVVGAFSALQPSCPPALAQDNYFSDSIIALLSDVISVVPVFSLACLPDAAAAQLSHDTIFPQS